MAFVRKRRVQAPNKVFCSGNPPEDRAVFMFLRAPESRFERPFKLSPLNKVPRPEIELWMDGLKK